VAVAVDGIEVAVEEEVLMYQEPYQLLTCSLQELVFIQYLLVLVVLHRRLQQLVVLMEVLLPLPILQDHLSPKEAVEVEVDLVIIVDQQEMLVGDLLRILLVDLVEVRKDLLGEPLIEVVVVVHTEIQDLSGG
jgi:hypothetical protein